MGNPSGKAVTPHQVLLIQLGLGSTKSKATIAREAGVSLSTVYRVIKTAASPASPSSVVIKGRKPLLSAAAAERGHQLLLDGQQRTAGEVAALLLEEGFTSHRIHRTTLVRAAKKVAKSKGKPIRSVSGAPGKLLNQATKGKRLAFAKKNLKISWKNVMFTDRKKFHHYFPGVKVRPSQFIERGQQRVALKVNHASTFNVYAGLTPFGMTGCAVVAGTTGHKSLFVNKKGAPARNITSEGYKEVLQAVLLPQGDKLFKRQGISTWQLQQDNDPTHRVAPGVIDTYNTSHSTAIRLLPDWPPSSPDLSPIENVWGWAQAKVDAMGCKTVQEFKQAVQDVLASIPREMCRKYFNSMKARMEGVITKEGGKTTY